MAHVCPVNVCDAIVPDRHLMCGSHWSLVPPQLRNAVWQAYRLWEEDKKNVPVLRMLRSAQRAAIDAVEAKLAATQIPRENTA